MIWDWFIKKSPVFIALSSLTIVGVLGLGVSGALAATGIILNSFTSESQQSSEDESDQQYVPKGDGSLPKNFDGIERIENVYGSCYERNNHSIDESCKDLSVERSTSLIESGWTGVKFNFTNGGYHWVVSGVMSGGTTNNPTFIQFNVNINGAVSLPMTFCYHYGFGKQGQTCGMESFGVIGGYGTCLPSGDTYVVEVIGGGLNFRETGIVPAGVIDCSSQSIPEPTAEPSPSPTSELSPTPTTEPSIEPTTEPSLSSP
jgi:hypothetical protein